MTQEEFDIALIQVKAIIVIIILTISSVVYWVCTY